PPSPPLITVPMRLRENSPQKPCNLVTSSLIQSSAPGKCSEPRQVNYVQSKTGRQQMPVSIQSTSTLIANAPLESRHSAAGGTPNTNGAAVHGVTPQSSESASGSEERRITRLAAQRKVVHTIEEDDDPKKAATSEGCLIIYPNGEPGAVPVHFADVECLKPEQMLNDTVIDFFLKYIHRELVPPEKRSSIFIFSSFFYGKLTNNGGNNPPQTATARNRWIVSSYKSVRTWTKNVDLFSKDYIVVPINEDIHWYLAIIAYPWAALVDSASSNGGLKKTQIIILDSLIDNLDPKRKYTAQILRDYLECEYNDKRKQKAPPGESFNKSRVEKIIPRGVPQQRNYTDCGLFLLKYAECFLTKPPLLVTRSDSFLRWYPRFNIKHKRNSILQKIRSLCEVEKWTMYERFSEMRGESTPAIEILSPTTATAIVPFRSPSPKPRLRSYSAGDEEERQTNIRRPLTP
uniref:Ubiquitin-like protease family profile domain-containing protein n=1 Tax=Parascaris univalens TaxID=6257 RepID=A0A915B1H8_PARUN